MITLRAMRQEEFPSYKDYFVVEYAKEIVGNYSYGAEKARAIAEQDITTDLPQGIATPHHYLLCIETGEADNKTLIGYFWYSCLDNETAFICDFYLFEPFRHQGYGKAALIALEHLLDNLSIDQIKLRVAYDNPHALALYQKMGFQITGYNMIRSLKQPKAM